MASTGINVLRYSALAGGIFYGLYHQAAITASNKLAAIDKNYEHKQQLIEKARVEYTKSKQPSSAKSGSGDIVRDPMDSKFDLEVYLKTVAAENP